ncbi:hypothetical protein CGMCC3_g741 [Colletotrichum fructicola]|nr:uncharacterized protein CGMCC3_g741 [Colletotrichum fructicola]KAE9583315.1 hypothetical protein CGMCC3_g741 [Colletotrichum fructicola]
MRIDPQQQYAPTLLVSSAFPVSPHEKSRETHEGPLPTRSAVVSPSIGPFYETPRPPPTLVIAFLCKNSCSPTSLPSTSSPSIS